MLQLRSWYSLAIATATVGVCFTPTNAHALTFVLGGTTIQNTPGANTFTYNLPSPINIVVGGVPASVTSATITGRGGASAITTAAGVSLNGAVLKLGNFNIRAISGGITDPNPNAINTFALFSNTFSFNIASNANIAIGQLLTGSFPNNTTGATNRVTFPSISVALGSGSLTSRGVPVTASSNSNALFRVPSNTSFRNGAAVSQITISAQLSDLVLASGQTLNLPASACTVIAEETKHVKLTAEDVARACAETGGEPEPVSVPEHSSVASLLAIAAVGGGAWFRRKRARSTMG